MYLINLSVVDVINSNFSRDYGIFNYLVSWILIIGMSYVIYKYFEKPITNLRDSKLFLSTNKRTSQK
jgi:peptidoglycan/LPS O-acetylase OafA/YrhL